jgi:hypothetical protein
MIAALAVAACDAPSIDRDCDDEEGGGRIEGAIITGQTNQVVAADLTVRGTATHTQSLVVRRILVAGIAAKNEGFNFEQWSAVVPIGVLGRLPASGGPDRVEIEAIAFDGCDQEFSLGEPLVIDVDRTPGVRVERLALDVAFPGSEQPDERFIPADGSASALITVVANADARGAAVTLTTNVGDFEGVTEGNVVHLAGEGMADATATVFLTADRAQDAIISAHTRTATAPAIAIDVAGAPTLVPSTAMLEPGDSISVTVFTDGKVESCQATPATGMTVRGSDDTDLMQRPAAPDSNGDGRIDFVVRAEPTLTTAVTTTVTCQDRYGQAAPGTFHGAP